MEEIKAYKLSNGEIVADQVTAKRRQHELDYHKGISEFVYNYGRFGYTLEELIVKHGDELLNVLLSK